LNGPIAKGLEGLRKKKKKGRLLKKKKKERKKEKKRAQKNAVPSQQKIEGGHCLIFCIL